MLFKELKIFLYTPPVLRCENVSALALASNPVFNACTKHIEVDYHFVREKVLNKDIIIKFISTQDQVADIFTKGLPSACFLALKVKLMVVPPPINLRGGVKGYQVSVRSSAESSVGLIVALVVASESNEERRRVLRLSAGSITASVAASESNEESRAVQGSIAYDMRSSAHASKAQSQYGKLYYIPQPPMTAWKETLGLPMCYNSTVCRRKTKPWTTSKISPSP